MTLSPAARRRHRRPCALALPAGYGSTRAGRARHRQPPRRLRRLAAAKKPPAAKTDAGRGSTGTDLAGTDGVIHSACGHQR